jgi:hypothetical protein
MSFDVLIGTAPRINEGAFYQLTDPSGAPLFDDEGNPVGITMLARNSAKGLAAMRANGNRRLAEARRTGTSMLTVESSEAEGTEVLVACTLGWTFDTLGGEPFPFSEANARKFWSDDRFRRWRAGAEDFFSSEANFMSA